MSLHTIEVAAAYSSLAIYGLGALGFLIFALTFLKTSFGHFLLTAMIAPIWPLFFIFALIRGDKTGKGSPQYIEIRR